MPLHAETRIVNDGHVWKIFHQEGQHLQKCYIRESDTS